MRVAEISVHSCPWRPPGSGDVGGMNLYILSIADELNKLGVDIDIFGRRHDSDEPDIIKINERMRLIHIRAGEPKDIAKLNIFNCLPEFQSNLLSFLKKDNAQYDVLHSHYWTSGLVAEQLKVELKVPNIVTFHTLGEVKNRALMTNEEPELRIQKEKKIVNGADCIIATTAEEKKNLVNLYGSHVKKVKVVPGGVDINLFYPMDKEKARRELHLDLCGKILLFVGRLQEIKGLELLLNAITCLPDGENIRLMVVGGNAGKTDEMARLKSLVKELGIGNKVDFIGAVAHEKMPFYYNAADICVVPSYHESFGLVAVEALACGTPVVASRTGGLATIVKDGETGYLLDKRSPDLLAMYLGKIIDDDALRESMSGAARLSVMKYDWPLIARRVLKVYREVTELSV